MSIRASHHLVRMMSLEMKNDLTSEPWTWKEYKDYHNSMYESAGTFRPTSAHLGGSSLPMEERGRDERLLDKVT